jgi:hypothetical protein
MPNSLTLTRYRLQIILMALAAATTHSTSAESEYLTLKRFFEAHPEQQVFVLSTQEGNKRHHA